MFKKKKLNKAQREYEQKVRDKKDTIKNLSESLDFLVSRFKSVDELDFCDENEKSIQRSMLTNRIKMLNRRISLCQSELDNLLKNKDF